jgi:pimeloyl-ACP methyl ester carboxylesterase
VNQWWGAGSAPILVLQGTVDILAVPENSKKLAADYPERVTVVEIPKAGRALLLEQPDLIAAAILTYLKH